MDIFELKKYLDPRSNFNGDDLYVTMRYYGPKIDIYSLKEEPLKICPHGSNDDYNFDNQIYSYFGNGNNEEPSLILTNSDGSNSNRFFYQQ